MRQSIAPHSFGAAAALALLGLGATGVASQEALLGVHAGTATDEVGRRHGALTVSPSVGWRGAGGTLRLVGEASVFDGGGALAGLGAEARAVVASVGRVAVVLDGTGGLTGSLAGYRSVTGSVRPGLRVSHGGWGVEAGPRLRVGGERARAEAVGGEDLFPLPGRPEGAAGTAWRRQRAVEVGAWAGHEWLRVRVDWQASSMEEVGWREWASEVGADLGAVSLAVRSGARVGDVEERWAGARAAWWPTPRAALVAEAGRSPSDPLTRRPGGEYAGLGLALRAGPATRGSALAAPRPLGLGEGGRLTLRAAPGARVELLGDWTGWRPEPAREVAPGIYEVDATLAPGVYRFSVRVDGRWEVPPGYESEPDGFGGRRAVLRVGEVSK